MHVVCIYCGQRCPVKGRGAPALSSITCTYCGRTGTLKRARRTPEENAARAAEVSSALAAEVCATPLLTPLQREIVALERQAAAQERIADALERLAPFSDAAPAPASAPASSAFVLAMRRTSSRRAKTKTARVPTVAPTMADLSPAERKIAAREDLMTAPEGGVA